MKHRLFNLAALLSLLLCALVLLLALVSTRFDYTFDQWSVSHEVKFSMENGEIAFFHANHPLFDASFSPRPMTPRQTAGLKVRWFQNFGISYSHWTWPRLFGTDQPWTLRISLTLPFLLSCVLPTMWIAARRWRRVSADTGLCPTCRSNLTGNTSGVCPECGTPVAGKAEPIR